jgi:hypothetical protein
MGFYGCSGLTSVTIPRTVSDIAFVNCTSLMAITVDPLNPSYSSVDGVLFDKSQTTLIQYPEAKAGDYTIPNSVTDIGAAFSGCTGLTSVAIPNSVTSIGDTLFLGCTSLITVTIPNSVTSIGGAAFDSCTSLTNATIPKSVTNIGDDPFAYCPSLMAITVDPLNPSYSSVDGVLFDKSQTTLIQYPGGKAGGYSIPKSVTNIGRSASAFRGCVNLTSITIPKSATGTIQREEFDGCTNLAAFTVDALNPTYSSVDGVLFDKTETTVLRYPTGKAGSYSIPNTVTSIGFEAFYDCLNLTGVTIPNSVTSIGEFAFHACNSLSSVTIPDSVTSIPMEAFGDCTSPRSQPW